MPIPTWSCFHRACPLCLCRISNDESWSRRWTHRWPGCNSLGPTHPLKPTCLHSLPTEKTTITHLGNWELGRLGDGAWGDWRWGLGWVSELGRRNKSAMRELAGKLRDEGAREKKKKFEEERRKKRSWRERERERK